MVPYDIHYRGAGFYAHDVDLAVWMHHVVAAIDLEADHPTWLDDLREDWHTQATQGFGFGIMPQLDKVVTDDRKPLLLQLFRHARDAMNQHPDIMTPDELNTLQASGPNAVFVGDLPMELFRRVGRGAVALLEGTPLKD